MNTTFLMGLFCASSGETTCIDEIIAQLRGWRLGENVQQDFLGRTAEIESKLKDLDVVDIQMLSIDGKFVPGVFAVKLRDGTHAVFKSRTLKTNSDYEVAAYQLDKMFGFDLVPPTVKRTINGIEGSLQYYVSGQSAPRDFDTETLLNKLPPEVYLFDYLIYQRDARIDSLLRNDGSVVLIDNGQSFSATSESIGEIIKARFDRRRNQISRWKNWQEKFSSLSYEDVVLKFKGLLPSVEIDRLWSRLRYAFSPQK